MRVGRPASWADRAATGASLLAALLASPLAGQADADGSCGPTGWTASTAGWELYRAGRPEAAARAFEVALTGCPDDPGALAGRGYAALRLGDEEGADRLFHRVLVLRPEYVDALVGRGIVAWRRGRLDSVREIFLQVRELDPDRPEAERYLSRLPAGLGAAPRRPPLERPDSLVHPARAGDRRLEVRTEDGWEPLPVHGVNLGAALPGRFPSQFPADSVYRRWVRGMAEAGFNAVRVYTIHPPGFYRALAKLNRERPDDPLWLIHGVWASLPPGDRFDAPAYDSAFGAEMRRAVDVVHGRASLRPRPGHASGHYMADVSRWTLAWVLGREWEPHAVRAFDRHVRGGWWKRLLRRIGLAEEVGRFRGRFVRLEEGTPMEAWLARACERIVAYEMEKYRAQRPVAYTNWPTLDPLRHPTETTVEEEVAIRRRMGEEPELRPREYDNDAVALDATRMEATGELPAGVFAAFHAYPYYPDFMVLDPGYRGARSPWGDSNYWGYLRELVEHHGSMPVLIAEYGVPAGPGIAHLQPQGWHHGGHDEEAMARIDARLTREILAAGTAGGAVFAWIDEWFKKNWLVIDFEVPPDRNRTWWNRLDPEQQYGMWAMEPEPPVEGSTVEERTDGWSDRAALLEGPGGATLRAAADEASLWLRLEAPAGERLPGRMLVGLDVLDPARGDRAWSVDGAPEAPVGLEHVLVVGPDTLRLLSDPGMNPLRLEPVREGLEPPAGPVQPPVGDPPPGFFTRRAELRYDRPYRTVATRDGRWDTLRAITNRPRFTRGGEEVLAAGYDRGVLPPGPPRDGFWERTADGGALEVRIPWLLLGFTDPGARRVLQDSAGAGPPGAPGAPRPGSGGRDLWEDRAALETPIRSVPVEAIRISARARASGGAWRGWPDPDALGAAGRFTWPTWDEPDWSSRPRPVLDSLGAVFDEGLGVGLTPAEGEEP